MTALFRSTVKKALQPVVLTSGVNETTHSRVLVHLCDRLFELNGPAAYYSNTPRVRPSEFGYPESVCNYDGKAQIEYIVSGWLLVTFPFHSAPCDSQKQIEQGKRSAVLLDMSGKAIHSFDLEFGQMLQAGPGGHILRLTADELFILDLDFSTIQTLAWPKEAHRTDVSRASWTATTSIVLAPSRQSFAIRGPYPESGVTYFEGTPTKQATKADSCSSDFAVTDGGVACLEATSSGSLIVHLMNDSWSVEDPLLKGREGVALPSPNQVLLLTNKFQLYQFLRPGNAEKLADLGWIAPRPRLGYSRVSFALSSSVGDRMLVSNSGVRIPLDDSSEIGYYQRIAVVDYVSGKIVFAKQFNTTGSDFALSPTGHFFGYSDEKPLV
jgi:hypothetical protein